MAATTTIRSHGLHRHSLTLLLHLRDVLHGPASVLPPIAGGCQHPLHRLLASGALDTLQLRTNDTDAPHEIIRAGHVLLDMLATRIPTTTTMSRLVINHHSLDVVKRAGAHGWHVKERIFMQDADHDLRHSIKRARAEGIRVGGSVHSVAAALRACEYGMDYIQVGTMFQTSSHPEKAHHALLEGPQLVTDIRRAMAESRGLPLPSQSPARDSDADTDPRRPIVVAIGGIATQTHVDHVIGAGSDGIAVISGILADRDPVTAARLYRQWLDDAASQPV